jgi:hypothetical protein
VTPDEAPIGASPARWCLCFFRKTSMPWFDRWFPGRYKHVSAMGYVQAANVWLFLEPSITGTTLMAETDGPRANALVNHWLDHADWLLMVPVDRRPPVLNFLGGWCVPTIARLIGRGHGALSPDGLWRRCRPYALEVCQHEDGRAETGPDADGAAAAVPAGSATGDPG